MIADRRPNWFCEGRTKREGISGTITGATTQANGSRAREDHETGFQQHGLLGHASDNL
jgi:hypothetical protein